MKPQQFTIPQQFMVGDIKIDTKAQLDRTYMRLLIDAFVPYQEAMLAYLDELIAKHAPQLVKEQLKEVEKQSKKKSTEWEQTLHQLGQTDKAEQKKITGRLQDLQNEESALHQTHMELTEKITIETRSQTILKNKRENIMKLLQRRQEMIEEGTWEKIGGKDKMSHVFSFIGDESYGFGTTPLTGERAQATLRGRPRGRLGRVESGKGCLRGRPRGRLGTVGSGPVALRGRPRRFGSTQGAGATLKLSNSETLQM